MDPQTNLEKEGFMNQETKQAISEAKQGIGLSKPYTSVDEMFEDILKDE